MGQIKTIFQFTYLEGIRKKPFIVSTILISVVIVVGCIVGGYFMNKSADKTEEPGPDKGSSTIYLVDPDGVMVNGLSDLQADFPKVNVAQGNIEDLDKYKESAKGDSGDVVILVSKTQDRPIIEMYTKNFKSGPSIGQVTRIMSKSYMVGELVKDGYDLNTAMAKTSDLIVVPKFLSQTDPIAFALSMIVCFLIFFTVYYYGYMVAMSIASEKSSRVMETLIVSAKPSRFLIGKIIGAGVLGLTQLVTLIIVAAVSIKAFIPGGIHLGGVPISLANVNPSAVFILITYFVLGYVLYAAMNSVTGAAVSKIEDLNSAMMPVTLVGLASFYLGYFVVAIGKGGIAQNIAIYLPFSSPFAVPALAISGEITNLQIGVSIGILILAIIVITYLSGKIYAASVLHYGKREKLTKLFKAKV